MQSKLWWVLVLTVIFLGAAFATLHAAAQVTGGVQHEAPVSGKPPSPRQGPRGEHPPPSAPEESATITDDPTVAPDSSQSADNDVSFPTDT
jgi:hypothetical protein